MKAVKIYLAVVTTLLLVAIGLGLYVWYTIQKLDGAVSDGLGEKAEESAFSSETAPNTETESITIEKADLSPSQQKILEGLGYESDSFTITPLMMACAESALGEERFNEIVGGAAPTPLESLRLLACFKK